VSGPTTYQAAPIKRIARPLVTVDPKPVCGRKCSECEAGLAVPGHNTRPPVTPPLPPVKPLPESTQLAELRLLIQANAEAISVLSLATSVPGPPGERGPAGPPGVAGAPFKLSDATDEEVAAFALRLPPLTFQAYTPDDKPFGKPLVKRLGETVDILSLTGPFQSR